LLIGIPALLAVAGVVVVAATLRPDLGSQVSGLAQSTASDVGWTTDAKPYESQVGLRIRYDCPPGGKVDSIYGTDVYTTDSSVCTAAVHAGRISLAGGGPVVIEIREGQNSYPRSERNGITSSGWGRYDASFRFAS
jgi:hypothetical protein